MPSLPAGTRALPLTGRMPRLPRPARSPPPSLAGPSRYYHPDRLRCATSLQAQPRQRQSLPTASLRLQPGQCRLASTAVPLPPANDNGPAKAPLAPKQKPRLLTLAQNAATALGVTVAVLGLGVVGFFLYDASTYSDENNLAEINVAKLALSPRTGGPKNLPIADVYIDDNDSEEKKRHMDKPHLVILGSGWGSVAILKDINPDDYHITVVSPRNYFLFTPMLPSATVGTLEVRSLVESIRRILKRTHGHYLAANAEDVEFAHKLVEVSQTGADGKEVRFYVPYDKLVIAVGSVTNSHGVQGLEHAYFLKDVNDARQIRKRILENVEMACLPTTSEEERRRLLSFVVSGGGPTGVEFAAELFDLLNEDLTRFFPKLLRNQISVHLIQSRSHILNTYDESVSKYAEERFSRDQVNVMTNSRVKQVYKDKIVFTQQAHDGTVVEKELPMGFCLWSTGVSQSSLCQRIAAKLENQNNRHALETDSHLRVIGSPLGEVYAIGDCSTVQNNIADKIITYLHHMAQESGKDPAKVQLTFEQWRKIASGAKKNFPQAVTHLKRLDKLFAEFDKDKSGTLDFEELRELLNQIDAKLTSLPATAQRANQQGQYLARKFNKIIRNSAAFADDDIFTNESRPSGYKAFDYHHLGSLAYLGNSAVFDFGKGHNVMGGLWAVYAWRGAYFAQNVSTRTRMLMAMDWTKRSLFGRDLVTF
ncbi:hypothetical protein BROUX41_002643 [Berkeleyomyces rouxiae]|uniref:uncharacterized protein n=1 Tax=Berkeleyomyces rouxiae TaxID=2035830 RepID=UPI003B7C8D27